MSHPFERIEPAKIKWHNGTPYSAVFDDIYFCGNGVAEKHYVFIEGNNLVQRWQNLNDPLFVIGEMGFGSGLNFLLTWQLWAKYAPSNAKLYYYSCEMHPLSKDDLKQIVELWPQFAQEAKLLIEEYPLLTPGFHLLRFEQGRVNLILMIGEALAQLRQLLASGDPQMEAKIPNHKVNAWYLDGFAPNKNQAMWSPELFSTLNLLSNQETTYATYTAASWVRKNLEQAGFSVIKKKGLGTKREMIYGCCLSPLTFARPRATPWHVSPRPTYRDKKAIVLGAGLAGCFTAHALAKRGWHVLLLDKEAELAQGASGNRQAVLYPKLSAFKSPLTVFMLSAYLYALNFYKKIMEPSLGDLTGILQVAFNEKEAKAQESLKEWLDSYYQLAALVSPEEGSRLAGIPLESKALWIKEAGWIDVPMLCRTLISDEKITFIGNTQVNAITYEHDLWQLGEYASEVVVLTTGHQINQFLPTQFLEIKSIRGQTTSIKATLQSSALKIPVCGGAHIIPEKEGKHSIGATFDFGVDHNNALPEDDEYNLAKLNQLSADVAWSSEVCDNWVGVRGATLDYLPLVGPVAIEKAFREVYKGLATNSNRWIPHLAPYHPGLYLCAAFGSRGLTSIPLCAEWLAGQINEEPSCLPRNLIQALAPARVLRKSIIK